MKADQSGMTTDRLFRSFALPHAAPAALVRAGQPTTVADFNQILLKAPAAAEADDAFTTPAAAAATAAASAACTRLFPS